MATFVIVHGAFGGGWEWTPVARALRRRGHEVFTPTLTGMGDRSHLGPEVGLSTHVADVVSLLEFEDLRDVVLCGASYGGMSATGAADAVPDRVALLIYLDALIPGDGQSGLDLLPPALGDTLCVTAQDGLVPIPAAILPPVGSVPEDRRSRYVARLRPHPVATFTEPLRLTGAIERIPRAFVRCTLYPLEDDPIAPMAALARARGWPYRELAATHDPQLFDPEATAAILDEVTAELLSSAR